MQRRRSASGLGIAQFAVAARMPKGYYGAFAPPDPHDRSSREFTPGSPRRSGTVMTDDTFAPAMACPDRARASKRSRQWLARRYRVRGEPVVQCATEAVARRPMSTSRSRLAHHPGHAVVRPPVARWLSRVGSRWRGLRRQRGCLVAKAVAHQETVPNENDRLVGPSPALGAATVVSDPSRRTREWSWTIIPAVRVPDGHLGNGPRTRTAPTSPSPRRGGSRLPSRPQFHQCVALPREFGPTRCGTPQPATTC
jgi:hypothetical protein